MPRNLRTIEAREFFARWRPAHVWLVVVLSVMLLASDCPVLAQSAAATNPHTAKPSAPQATAGRTVLRRLNRTEYENTVRDLLGVQVELKELLPPDSTAGGFDNVGDAHHLSSFLMERYVEAADTALQAAIANSPKPPPRIQKRYSLKETHHVKVTDERVFRKGEDNRVIMFCSSPWQAVVLSPFYPPDRGEYRFRISTQAVQSQGKPVTFRVDAGLMLMTGKPHLVSYFDAPAERSTVIEFTDQLESRNTIRILPYGLPNSQTVHKIGADTYEGPGLAIDWVEVDGPVHDEWPPACHQRIWGELKQAPAPNEFRRDRVEVVSESPREDARRVLARFASRAFRRPANASELDSFVTLVERRRAEGDSFEQAVRVGLTAILVSPQFLFLREAPGPLDDFALASRLSYFFWSSMPDDELLGLAERGKLSEPETLRRQVDRLLEHRKSQAFVTNFVGQWLNLRDIDFTIPSHLLYPEFDEMLKVSMVREAELFFAELLRRDESLLNIIASDFAMLNGRLARHYGIPGIEGWEFRRVSLPPDSHRGGVLTMAGVAKVTANGTSTSPVTRGAWILERILGQPPAPPPENVAALEPDIRGAKTMRQQLEKHREIPACASCHAEIDPLGFALENLDVIGGWREHYRTTGNGKPVTIDGRRMPYLDGLPVDPKDALSDGRAFRNIDELKQLLLADRDTITRALATKLVTYATGAVPNDADDPQLDALVARVRAKQYGLRGLIHEIVASDLFQRK